MRCDRVVCLSNAIARDLDPVWHASGRITVVHPGVDLPDMADPAHPVPPKVLVLAAIEEWKGQHLALEAVAPLESVELILAGATISGEETEYLNVLRARASQPDLLGRVSFPGWIDSDEALGAATMLLHTAPHEPFGRSLINALAMGRPVVAFNSAGPSEILTPDCGRLVPEGDVLALTNAIREIASDPHLAAAMGAAGRRRVASDFDAATQAVRWQRAALSLAPTSPGVKSTGPTALDGHNAKDNHSGPGENLSLVTVIHDSAPDLARLLASASRHLPGAEVVVVDSGSTDGGSSVATTWRGDAKVVQLPGNEGYGAGCVAGLELVTRHVSVLINPDVELIDASLADLADELELPGGADRIFSPMLIHPDGKRQDAVHPIPGTGPELVRALAPAGVLPERLARWVEPHRADTPTQVGWAVGACLLARTDVFRMLGPFDPTVHLYAEDLDLCLRADKAGIETWYRPDSRVIHREAHSTRHAFGGEPSDLLAKRRRTVVSQQLGSGTRRKDDAIQLITHVDRLILKRLSGKSTEREKERIAALLKARKAQ
jgi:GT2 family glycosyltransferase